MQNLLQRKRAGFTLVELLIVITIIGILVVALLPRLTGGREKARDAARLSHLQQISTALEFMADDNSGVYPTEGGTAQCVSEVTGIDTYLTSLPSDPTGQGWSGACGDDYTYVETGSGYLLIAELENANAQGDNIYEGDSWTPTLTGDTQTILGAATPCTGSCTEPLLVVGR